MSKPWLALVLLVAVAICACAFVRAQGPPGSVTISHAQCSSKALSRKPQCNDCIVDIGNWQGSQYCWATICTGATRLDCNACVSTPTLAGPCNSDGVFDDTCTGCNSWHYGVLNPADPPAHPYPYCDLGSGTCKTGKGDWQGNWQYWRLCT
jgi:hypothetical protein